MLNSEASKPRVMGGLGPWGPPGSAPERIVVLVMGDKVL